MSRWSLYGGYRPAPKKPPPERGIRMTKAGTTWWGRRWIEALEGVLRGDARRLARGKTYARAGRTHDLVVKGGTVTASVIGSRPTPYRITIALTQLAEPAWTTAIAAMASKAQFSAELLGGQMPQAIDDAFVEAGVSLFPKQRTDLRTSCTCPDWGDPCKHVAATHYVLGEALDRDPFLLFELRGKTKEQVLDALRAARGGAHASAPTKGRKAKRAEAAAPEVPTVKLGKLDAAEYDRPREALPALRFMFHEPVTHGAVLRQLGAPAGWTSDASPADILAPIVRAAAETARRIALGEPPTEAEVAVRPRPKRGRAR
ncbi:MAG: SWIM zinc finger family protein [Deltaproteobacteria bacterium]|nr:SWIM zinc finger family protein [Deltaproteobacteria bacterium]